MNDENRLTAYGVIDKYLYDEEVPWPSNHAQRILERLAAEGYAVVKVPTVAHKGPYDTDASVFQGAAKRLEGGYEAGGSNTKCAIAKLLRSTAHAIEHRPGNDDVAHLITDARAVAE